MGYTHYWYRTAALETPEMFGRFAIDAIRLVQVAAAHGIPTEAEFTEGYLSVNGAGPDACENLYWPAVMNPGGDAIDGEVFQFAKTRLRPYDPVVTALLLRARVVYAGMKFASDGTWDSDPRGEGDWVAGRILYADTFGEQFPADLEPPEVS